MGASLGKAPPACRVLSMRYGRPARKLHHLWVLTNRFPALLTVYSMIILSGSALTLAASTPYAVDSDTTAVSDTTGAFPPHASGVSDTAASIDTTRIEDSMTGAHEPVWTKEELKEVIERQSGIIAEEEQTWENTKSPKTAMLCALLVPGLGQIYNDRPFKAMIAFGVETFYLSQIALNKRYAERQRNLRDQYDYEDPDERNQWIFHDIWATEHDERAQDWVWWSVGIIAIIVLDAYVDAHLHDMRIEVGKRPQQDEVAVMFTFKF